MIMFREEIVQLEKLIQQQKQVWNDSADYGIPYTSSVAKQLRTICESLDELGKSRFSNKSMWQAQWFIPIEHDEGRVIGYHVSISFTDVDKMQSGKNSIMMTFPEKRAYFTINIRHGAQ